MKRTPQQNKSVHLHCRLLAEALNDAGYDMKATLKEHVDIPWTEENVKWLWQKVSKEMYGKSHTSELEPNEVTEVYEVINRTIAERTGVHVPFPHNEKPEYPSDEGKLADKF